MALDCDWNNELTLKFVRHIAAERALWDFNDPKYKLKHKVNEAWSRISSRMNRPVDALKNKKKVLMATWRPLFRKKMASLKAQAAEDEVFQPVWFAYDAMESYLGSVYDIDGSLTTEYLKQHEEPTAPSPSPSNQSEHSDDITVLTIKKENDERTDSSTTTTPHLSKKRKNFMGINYNEGQNIHYSSFDPLNSESASQGASASASRAAQRTEEGDECDIYAKLLARRLRKYPGKMRDRMMYKIDGLLLDNPYPDELSSPCSSYQLAQLVLDIKRIYTLSIRWRRKRRVYEQTIWYTNCARKYIDILYTVEHAIQSHGEFVKKKGAEEEVHGAGHDVVI
ncbi:uncharacterized protein [Maniola hyperantus]|uniref:uncharacterized protein isoform X3 n=1 Tax=Aphantopus hyperantus TaxID=2795564 RepID=UPI00212BFD78